MKNKIIVGYSTNRNLDFQNKFNKELKKSIGCDHSIIAYENDGSLSLTEVYNNIWNSFNESNNIIFCFIHHDIHFKSNGWGKNLLNLFNSNDKQVDIIGVAGTDKLSSHGVWWLDDEGNFTGKNLYGKVWHTDGKKEWKSDFTGNKICKKLQLVSTIDGLFIAFNPNTCENFDEDFKGFHFYDISFVIKNFIAGRKIYVTETIPICHESGGNTNEQWECNRQLLINKYNNFLPSNITY